MSKLPATKSRKFIKFILQIGYEYQRCGKGSHERYHFKDPISGDGNLTLARSADIIPSGILIGMLKLISEHTGIPVAELRRMLERL